MCSKPSTSIKIVKIFLQLYKVKELSMYICIYVYNIYNILIYTKKLCRQLWQYKTLVFKYR